MEEEHKNQFQQFEEKTAENEDAVQIEYEDKLDEVNVLDQENKEEELDDRQDYLKLEDLQPFENSASKDQDLNPADLSENKKETESPPKSSLFPIYNSLLSQDLRTYSNPFHERLKKEGKFHSTLLLNYFNNAGDFVNETLLKLEDEEISLDQTSWSARSLQIAEDLILFSGGNNSSKTCFVLNTVNKKTTSAHSLNIGRDLHALAWLDFKPAVLGGYAEEALTSVEVLEEDKWVEIASLNHARYGHSAVCHNLKTWVFGGAKGKSSPVESVEVYCNEKWSELQLRLPFQRVGVGIFAVESKIYLLGGYSLEKRNSSSVVSFEIEEERFLEEENLEEPASFSQNLWKIKEGVLESYSFRGKKVEYRIR